MGETAEHVTWSPSAKRRGVKNYLLSRGIKITDMHEFLQGFFMKYGHEGVDKKSLPELLEKSSLWFMSLRKYTQSRTEGRKNPRR